METYVLWRHRKNRWSRMLPIQHRERIGDRIRPGDGSALRDRDGKCIAAQKVTRRLHHLSHADVIGHIWV